MKRAYLPVEVIDKSLGLYKVKIVSDRETKVLWVYPDELVSDDQPKMEEPEVKVGQIWRDKIKGNNYVVSDTEHGIHLFSYRYGIQYFRTTEAMMKHFENTGKVSKYVTDFVKELMQ